MAFLVLFLIVFFFAFRHIKKKRRERDEYAYFNGYAPKQKSKSPFVLIVAVFIGVLFFSSLDSGDTPAPQATTAPTVRASAAAPTTAPTVQPESTPVPTTLEDWAEAITLDVLNPHRLDYDDGFRSVECQEVDGDNGMMVTINLDFGNGDTAADTRIFAFLNRCLKLNHQFSQAAQDGKIQYGSLMIMGWSPYLDDYGNEFDAVSAQLRIKSDTAAKINYDNFQWDMLPGIATTFAVHPIVRDKLSADYYLKLFQ